MVVTDCFKTLLAMSMLNVVAAVTHESSASCNSESSKNRTNWSENVIFSAEYFCSANSVDRVQALVRSSNEDPLSTTLTVLGTGHSFNTIADNVHTQLSVLPLHKAVALELDKKTETVTVDAGITYSQLCPWLDSRGFALANLASLTDITVAGAISTATHGSGGRNGNLATSVSALQFVTANGKVRSHNLFPHNEFPYITSTHTLGYFGAVMWTNFRGGFVCIPLLETCSISIPSYSTIVMMSSISMTSINRKRQGKVWILHHSSQFWVWRT